MSVPSFSKLDSDVTASLNYNHPHKLRIYNIKRMCLRLSSTCLMKSNDKVYHARSERTYVHMYVHRYLMAISDIMEHKSLGTVFV